MPHDSEKYRGQEENSFLYGKKESRTPKTMEEIEGMPVPRAIVSIILKMSP